MRGFRESTIRPLDGITVVAIEQAIAGPYCTRQLADLGARVIKIERPDGGDFARDYDSRVNGLSSHFVWANRSKESMVLDLKSDDDLAVLDALLGRADVLLQNLAPGATDRMGLSFDALHARHPKLIVCSISGYGPHGPYSDKKAYDLLIQSEAGFLSVTGSAGGPAKAGMPVADISAAMYAFSAILAALIERGRTGLGRNIEISMLESLVEWMGFPLYYTYDGAPPPEAFGAEHATIYPYGPFRVAGEQSVMLGVQNEREWASFCQKVLRRPDLIDDPRYANGPARSSNRASLREIIEATFAHDSAEAVIERLEQAAIANAMVRTMADVWQHPQLAARGRWTQVDTEAGAAPALTPPFTGSATAARMDAIPAPGEHTDSILAELGLNPRS